MSVKRFRTKPVEIEAMQFTGDNYGELFAWTGMLFDVSDINADPNFPGMVYDKLHDTWISVASGQWIVRGAKGEYYPCDNETFHWKYEEMTWVDCDDVHPQADIYHPEGHWKVNGG